MTAWHHLGFSSQLLIIHPSYRQPRYLLSALLKLGNPLYLDFNNYDECFNGVHSCDFLILDEFDRLDEHLTAQFLARVQQAYPEKAIVIFSRDLPNLAEEQRKAASILPIDEDMGLVDFYARSKPVLEFFGFGSGGIAVNGKRKEQYLSDTQINLLFYLLENGGTSRNVLLKMFWKQLPEGPAIKTLHNVKQQLNEILGVDAILFHQQRYQLNHELELVYDVANYRRLIDTAYNTEPSASITYFAQAHDIYKSDFLQRNDAPWASALRQKLLYTHADVQVCLGQLHAQKAQKEQAATWYSFALKHNPVRDDVLLALIQLFLDLQMPSYARDFFKHYKEILQEQYGIRPNKDFDDLLGLVG